MHKFLPNTFIFLDHYDHQIFKNNNTNIGVIYRNYESIKRENELIKIANACKNKRYKLFVSNDLRLALKAKADGIYIPSFNKKNIFRNLQNRNLIVLGSAHNQKEINEKISQNCKIIFLSPIFNIKKSKNYLNISKFNFLTFEKKINFFALGGISNKNLCKLRMLNIKGFAGKSIFKKKPAYKRPVFLKNKILLNF